MSQNPHNSAIDIDPGFYTIVYGNGEHRTIRVKVPREGYFAGKKIIGFLCGPDNTQSYKYFGTLHAGRLMFWGKFSASVDDLKIQRIRKAILLINDGPGSFGKAYALTSGRCYVCNRLLTHPESIETGIGPECSKRKAARRAA